MFDNIGGKIKVVAQVVCWIGIITSVISGIVTFEESVLLGFLIMIVGSFISWISSFTLYGFGELIEATCETRDMTYEIIHRKGSVPGVNDVAPVTVVRANAGAQARTAPAPANGWKCACGRVNAGYVSTCVCGRTKNEKKQEPTDAQ